MFAITTHTFVQGSVLMGKLRVNRWSPMKRISRAFSFINFLISTFKFCLSFKAGLSYKDFFWFQGSWVSGGLHFTHFLALNFNLLFVGGLGSWIFRFSGFGFMLFVGIHGSPTTSGRHIQATWGLDLKVRGFFLFHTLWGVYRSRHLDFSTLCSLIFAFQCSSFFSPRTC